MLVAHPLAYVSLGWRQASTPSTLRGGTFVASFESGRFAQRDLAVMGTCPYRTKGSSSGFGVHRAASHVGGLQPSTFPRRANLNKGCADRRSSMLKRNAAVMVHNKSFAWSRWLMVSSPNGKKIPWLGQGSLLIRNPSCESFTSGEEKTMSKVVAGPREEGENPESFSVESNVTPPEDTERFLRLQALLKMRRLYRCISYLERICGKGKPHGKGGEMSKVEQMKEQLASCSLKESSSAEELTEEHRFQTAVISANVTFDAVKLCDKMQDSKKRMDSLLRDMDDEGCYERLWEGGHEAVRQLLQARIAETGSLLDASKADLIEFLPGDTLEDARQSVEEFFEREAVAQRRREQLSEAIRTTIEDAGEEIDKIRETPVAAFKDFKVYAGGVWSRLNGGGSQKSLVTDLPRPVLMQTGCKEKQLDLTLQIAERDKEFKEGCRDRETRLRKESVLDRARRAGEIRAMDKRVDALRRALAVESLELQMEFIYGALEEEAAEVIEGGSFRDREVELYVAEFGSLDAKLAELSAIVDRDEAVLIDDEYLAKLATDVPDLKIRLGILDDPTAPAMEVSTQRMRRSLSEARNKLAEGVASGSRSVRLLGGDVWYALSLIGRALQGNSLKTREVLALRRTSRDLLTFPLFAAILIAPLTPVGHVLIFSFMQQYFPGLFPSQFSSRRQELLQRYEELTLELREAEQNWMNDSEKGALIAAEAAVAALLNSDSPGLQDSDAAGRRTVRELRKKFKSAEESVQEYEEESEPEESEPVPKRDDTAK